MKVLGLNRVEMLVNDAPDAQQVFGELFNGATFHKEGAEDLPVDSYMAWDLGIELVVPKDPNHNMAKRLKTKGEGVFTVVFEVENIDDAREHLKEKGFDIVYDHDFGPHDGFASHKQICVSPTRTHGLLVMLMERKRA
jgi:4-hydroxyphenylpyruvate dioxygenase-like putative hemolysin